MGNLLTSITFFISIILYGQETTKADIVKFKIKSVSTVDGDGKITEIIFYNEHGDQTKIGEKINGQLVIRKEFIYDKNNVLIEERMFTHRGTIQNINRYFYNTSHQLIKKESKNLTTTWDYEYDALGNLVKETRKSGNPGTLSTTVFKYDGGILKEELTTDGTVGKEKHVEYKYNDKGLLAESKTKYFYFNTTVKKIYTYNYLGKLIQLDEKPSNGVSSRTTYEYNFDGLLLSESWRGLAGKGFSKITYQIEY
jgi:YD repeat-containing protein